MKRSLIVAAALALVLTSCSSPEPTPDLPSQPVPEVSTTVDLNALRQQYGLPECPDTDPAAESVQDGLPRTELACLGTDQVVNLAGLPREPMVLNFWAQWCAPCRQEAPYLREAFQLQSDVAFVGINYQDPQPDWALEFAALAEWNYPHIQDMERTLQTSLKVPGLPVTLFVSANGEVAARHVGGLESTEQLLGLIDEHLGLE
ncbi:MAG: redoxin domain-containing protein [Arachnia sp.]